MIAGIGIDIIELDRVEKMLAKPKFIDRILTENEQELFNKLTKRRQLEFLAGRFAAKEAYSKARGTGIGAEVSFHDIEILPDERGKPVLHSNDHDTVHLSISHSFSYAVAQVIIEGNRT